MNTSAFGKRKKDNKLMMVAELSKEGLTPLFNFRKKDIIIN